MKQDDVDVRWADQEQINEFGRLNNRLLEIRAESKQAVIDAEKLDDATAELMMASSSGDGNVMLLIGESFIESTEDEANDCKLRFVFPLAWSFEVLESSGPFLVCFQIASGSRKRCMTELRLSNQKKTILCRNRTP